MSKNKKYINAHSEVDSLSELRESRIIRKNLVYVIGLSQKISSKEILLRPEYFGQYGKIIRAVVNKKKAYNLNHPYGPSYSAYITYSKPEEASLAILSLDNTTVHNHLIRASFGTTKYCSFFLNKKECINKDCLFLHQIANERDIIKREDLNVNKSIFYEQQIYAMRIIDIYNPIIKRKILKTAKQENAVFPTIDTIYQNEIVIKHQPNENKIVAENKKIQKNIILPKKKNIIEKKELISNSKTNVLKSYSEDIKKEDNNKKEKLSRNKLKLLCIQKECYTAKDEETYISTCDENMSPSSHLCCHSTGYQHD